LGQFSIRQIISDKIGTLMDRSLLKQHTKFGAKIFHALLSNYILSVGPFIQPYPVDCSGSGLLLGTNIHVAALQWPSLRGLPLLVQPSYQPTLLLSNISIIADHHFR